MKLTLVGAGNLATCLGRALQDAGHDICQVWSRTETSARTLAEALHCAWTTSIDALSRDTELYIVSVKDSALQHIANQLPADAFVVHTAGSMHIDTLPQPRRGVFYPMQTFSKQKPVDFEHIPVFIEANNADRGHEAEGRERSGNDSDLQLLQRLAESVTRDCRVMDSDQRRYLHVAAVFACNMANHCYALAADILGEHGIPFEVMLPLIDETAAKVHRLTPQQAQTGPAVRWDENVMQRHMAMLDDSKRNIYQTLSQSIHEASTHHHTADGGTAGQ